MAKKKGVTKKNVKEVNEIDVVAEIVKPKIPKKTYVIKNRVSVSGKWYEKGDQISLTKEGQLYFASNKYI